MKREFRNKAIRWIVNLVQNVIPQIVNLTECDSVNLRNTMKNNELSETNILLESLDVDDNRESEASAARSGLGHFKRNQLANGLNIIKGKSRNSQMSTKWSNMLKFINYHCLKVDCKADKFDAIRTMGRNKTKFVTISNQIYYWLKVQKLSGKLCYIDKKYRNERLSV